MRQAVVICGFGTLFAAGCASLGGTVAAPGATPNQVIGSEVEAGAGQPPIGVMQAGLMDAEIGQVLSETDRPIAAKAEFEALEYARAGRPTKWQNPRSGNSGEITVGAAYQVNLLDCREYTHKVVIGGRPRFAKGTACRRPDGRWNIIR
jgi:surface antigen